MGKLSVRVADEASDLRAGTTKEIARGERSKGRIVGLDSGSLAASLQELTAELGALFANIRSVGAFELNQVAVGVEISAEGGFNLIGSLRAGGKGAITLTFSPKP